MKFLGIDLNGLWWSICRGLMQIIEWLGQAFNFLVGADTIDASANGGTGDNIGNLFVTIFNGGEGSSNMTRLYLMIMIGCVAFLCIFIAIGAVKAQFTKGPTESLQNIGFKSLFTLIKMIAIPIVFFVALQAMGYIFNFLIGVMNQGNQSVSLAQSICDACYTGSGDIQFTMKYNDLTALLNDNGGEFNYLMCILASAFLVVTLVTVSITLTKRIIEVFFYYLSAPIALCRTPLDDGKSFDLWKENVVAKLLSAGGIIICMYLFYTIIPLFNNAVTIWQEAASPAGSRDSIANVIKILFVIGGSCVPASASMLMAQLISQGAGQNESNNMMHTQQMMGNAMRLAGAVGSHALLGAMGGVGTTASTAAKGVGAAAKMLGGATSALGGGGGAAAAMGSAAGAASAASGGFTGAVGAAARTGAAAMAAFSGAGGAAGTGAATGSVGADAARAPSGAGSTSSGGFKGFIGNVGSNFASSWRGAKGKMANTSPFLGAAGKVGALFGAGLRLAAGAVTAIPKAAVKSISGGIANTKFGRHHAKKVEERQAAARLKSEGRREQTAAERTAGKYSSLERAMKLDAEGKTTSNTSQYMMRKIDAYEARAGKVESFLGKQSGWSEETKREYRRSQLESEASRIGAYADVARGHMDEDSIKRFQGFYQKMSNDLYGEDVK